MLPKAPVPGTRYTSARGPRLAPRVHAGLPFHPAGCLPLLPLLRWSFAGFRDACLCWVSIKAVRMRAPQSHPVGGGGGREEGGADQVAQGEEQAQDGGLELGEVQPGAWQREGG